MPNRRAHHHLASGTSRLPRGAHPRGNAPLPARSASCCSRPCVPFALLPAMIQSGSLRSCPALARDRSVGRRRALREIEVEDAAVLLGEAAIPVVAHAGGQAQRRRHLELVLHVTCPAGCAVVAAGIALQERRDIEPRRWLPGVTNPCANALKSLVATVPIPVRLSIVFNCV